MSAPQPSLIRADVPIVVFELTMPRESEFHAAIAYTIEHGYQVRAAAAQPVELPDGHCVAAFEVLQTPEQGRALGSPLPMDHHP